ncbi:MAG TPA: alpha-amylase family glycosyl hydrolase, partial [Cryomorphaceae bacterium]|nr:alpha-amylase family glycosyl hydrolase [Cryomorphaceae bacterium]
KLSSTIRLENPNYIILKLSIPENARPQELTIRSKSGDVTMMYELRERSWLPKGLNPADFIYLITPDRFANGNLSNDVVENMQEVGIDRSEPYQRHGGDIQGMIDHLDFMDELGVTAVWPNPLLENDQPRESYHGYAFTDYYKIDPRFGTNSIYRAFVDSLHNREMKIIQDVVYNHIGNNHYLYTDIPDSSWFHFWEAYTRTNYRAPALFDPYASDYDKNIMTDGWFDTHMPDLNQKNPHLATYLIQQTLWWVEAYNIDALRIDTYAYPDQGFMREWGEAVKMAYPTLFLFAETWVHGSATQGWFMGEGLGPEENYLDGLTDFQLHYAINDALTRNQGWTDGIARLYYTLAKDYIYKNPEKMITFLDNHDLARFYGVVNRDFEKFKMGIGMLMTMRGIPSLYYGTEVLMSETDGHGKIREDFSGGWPTDSLHKFSEVDRTVLENEAFQYISKLAKLRKKNPALHSGETTQYVPMDGLYVYFRHSGDQIFMAVVNTSEKAAESPSEKYAEFLAGQKSLTNILTNENVIIPENFKFEAKSFSLFKVR